MRVAQVASWLLIPLGLSAYHIGHSQTICIDPGHPSETSAGTRGRHTSEIRAAWMVALRLKQVLISKGATVVMTKTSEFQKVTNRRRAEIANEAGADLMVRLHCDAYSGSGFAVYYPTRKGRVSGVKGPSDAVIEATKPVAKRFYAVLAHDLTAHLRNNGLKGDTATAIGSKQGALTGSIFSKVPVVLVEMVDLKNPKDETFITSEYGLTLMSKSLADAALKAVAKQ